MTQLKLHKVIEQQARPAHGKSGKCLPDEAKRTVAKQASTASETPMSSNSSLESQRMVNHTDTETNKHRCCRHFAHLISAIRPAACSLKTVTAY